MAYTLRDIIKQRTGEVAATQIQPTIYKFKKDDEWQINNNIEVIGTSHICPSSPEEITTKLPENMYIKQVGTNVRFVCSIKVENNIIPPDIFKYAINVESFKLCFHYGRFEEIPSNLFANCKNVKSFQSVFNSCIQLKNIPDNLFANNIKAENFDRAFFYCKSLKNIPENLFANNINAKRFEEIFSYCKSLKYIPTDIFNIKNNKNSLVLDSAFKYCENACNFESDGVDIIWKH